MNINAPLFCSKCKKKDPDTDKDRLICNVCHFADHKKCYNEEKDQCDFMCQACIKNYALHIHQQRQIDALTLPYDDLLADDKDFEWKYKGRGPNARMGFSYAKKERAMFTPKIMTFQIMNEVFRVQTETPYDTVRDLKNAVIHHFDDTCLVNKMLVRGQDGNAMKDSVLLTNIIDGSEFSF
jgi:hypothetical protein